METIVFQKSPQLEHMLQFAKAHQTKASTVVQETVGEREGGLSPGHFLSIQLFKTIN